MGGGLGGGFHSNKHIGRKQKGKISFNNQRQNEEFQAVVTKLKLNKEQARKLHDEISGEGYGYQEILEEAKYMFKK